MQCQHAHEHFSDYVAGQLDRPLAVTIDNHLSECTTCREEVAGLRRVWTELDGMPVVDPPMFFHENLMHRINAELDSREETAARRRAIWDWRALLRPRALAATGALALIVLFAGAGFVHTQSAAMWPFSIFAGNPAPTRLALQKPDAQWMPDAATGNGGVLVVRLQLDGVTVPGGTDIDYTVRIERSTPDTSVSVSGTFLPNGAAIANLPLNAQPDSERDTLVITTRGGKDNGDQRELWHQPLQLNTHASPLKER